MAIQIHRPPVWPRLRMARVLCAAFGALALLSGAVRAGEGAPRLPNRYEVRILLHSTIAAVDHANRTGNYTVLRDLAAPRFRAVNTAARLALLFRNQHLRRLDLSPVLVYEPVFTRPVRVDAKGHLRLVGYFPTRPLQVNFDLAFAHVAGRWRLFAVSVNPAPAGPSQVAQAGRPGAAAGKRTARLGRREPSLLERLIERMR